MKILYEIFEVTSSRKGMFKMQPKDITFTDKRDIDFANLRFSKANKKLFEIPYSAQKELDEKGETVFTVTTKTIVRVYRK